MREVDIVVTSNCHVVSCTRIKKEVETILVPCIPRAMTRRVYEEKSI